jgi:hypothetical protein
MTAAAHPTPDCTKIAAVGQFRLQAPHSMQASRFLILARPEPFMAITAWGHTSMHRPQPIHLSSWIFSVTTFLR